jgi:serine/threonine protein kinase
MKDLIGVTIDRYKIINQLGVGGMAVVYRAIDTLLDRNVAVKILLPEVSSKEKLLKRFNREAKTLANLSHSNIVKVMDYGEHEGLPYLVLEFISGGTLSDRLEKPLPYAEAAAILAPIARALAYAHQQKVVHRDIKPANILLNDSGQAMLSDFGILKMIDVEESHGLTGTGKIAGTPAYMSPEQIRGKEIDGRSDIYSLGIVFFEMVTGRKPYTANTPIELSMQHLHDPIPKAKQYVRDIPPVVEQIFVKAMAKKPEERYQSMTVFATALEKLAGITTTRPKSGWDIPAVESNGPSPYSISKLNKIALVIASMVILLGIGAVFFRQQFFGTTESATPVPIAIDLPTALPPTVPPKVDTPTATPVALTPDNSNPTTSSAAVIRAGNVSELIQTNRIEKISVIKTEWMQNGEWIINVGSDGVSFIDPDEAVVKEKIDIPGEIPISMAISPSNDRLYVLVGGNIRVYNIQTLKLVHSYPVTGGASSLAVSADGSLVALGISDSKVQLLNAEDGRVIRNIRSNYGGWAVAFSPDSSIVAGGTSQGVLIWEASSGSWLPLSGGQNSSVKSLAFSNDGRTLAGGSKGTIFLWNVANGEMLVQADGNFGNVNSLDFSPDDSILVTGSDDGLVRLWNTNTGTLLRSLTAHTSSVFSVTFSPDGQQIVSGANEGTILMWRIP